METKNTAVSVWNYEDGGAYIGVKELTDGKLSKGECLVFFEVYHEGTERDRVVNLFAKVKEIDSSIEGVNVIGEGKNFYEDDTAYFVLLNGQVYANATIVDLANVIKDIDESVLRGFKVKLHNS